MKVFFVSTPRTEGQLRKNLTLIYDEVQRLGYELSNDFVKSTPDGFYTKMQEGRKSHISFYNEMQKSILTSDICMFEVSMPSLGIGFLIQKALEQSKPCILLYYKDNIPYIFSGNEDEKLLLASYDEKNYKKVVKKLLDVAREKRDKRFNFFLSPKLLNYIESASNKQGVTKSKLLRDMIIRHMHENEE